MSLEMKSESESEQRKIANVSQFTFSIFFERKAIKFSCDNHLYCARKTKNLIQVQIHFRNFLKK